MLPRECDNDACDYDSYTDSEGRVRVRWEHAPECRPVEFTVLDSEQIP